MILKLSAKLIPRLLIGVRMIVAPRDGVGGPIVTNGKTLRWTWVVVLS
jgi:hypothetical protein